MGWTKRQYINLAFVELGIASTAFDIQPEQYQSALFVMDAMVADWNSIGIRLGYPLTSSPEDSELDEETIIPDAANKAIYLNLALSLAAGYGKEPSRRTVTSANSAYKMLLARAAEILPRRLPSTMPAGAGNKAWISGRGPFIAETEEALLAGEDAPIEFW